MTGLTAFAENIRKWETFVLISHVSIDGDTLGSAAALSFMLDQMGKRCFWVGSGGIPYNLSTFPELMQLTLRQKIEKPQAAIAVDCADVERMECNKQHFQGAQVHFVIDHHKTNTGFGDWNYICPYPATAQCVFELLKELKLSLTPEIARALYIAFLTDTGRFSHSDVGGDTMHAVAELYNVMENVPETNDILFGRRTFAKTRLMGKALSNIELAANGRIAYYIIEQKDFNETGASQADCEGLIRYALEIDGVCAAFSLKKLSDNEGYKVSLRAKNEKIDVAQIAQRYGGGGHTMAAGCTCNGIKESIVQELIKEILGQIDENGLMT